MADDGDLDYGNNMDYGWSGLLAESSSSDSMEGLLAESSSSDSMEGASDQEDDSHAMEELRTAGVEPMLETESVRSLLS